MSAAQGKEKVVILGGGIASITTALRLTDDPNWRDRFESITIYQQGWRLGGKGATGRGPEDRIEEHGLHIYLGFYENAFKIMRKVYADLKRPADTPLATLEQAFTGHDYVGVMESINGRWEPWVFNVPPNGGSYPGVHSPRNMIKSLQSALQWLATKGSETSPLDAMDGASIKDEIMSAADKLVADGTNAEAIDAVYRFKIWAESKISQQEQRLSSDNESRRAHILFLFATTIALGLLLNGITKAEYLSKLDGVDFAKWLKKYTIFRDVWDPERNALVRGLYDFGFGYLDGDSTKPNFAAGPALRTLYRMLLTYQGSVFYKMNAGMGDTVFAPAYEVLISRGVAIKLFRRLINIGLDTAGRTISTLKFAIQATVKTEPYIPLAEIRQEGYKNPLPCWPAYPLYDQLSEGDTLMHGHYDLESFWTQWSGVGEEVLKFGSDFHKIVFGISLASIPFVGKELVNVSQQWKDMTSRLRTVATQAVQLWLEPDLPELGWVGGSPVLDAWIQPFNTWGDMTSVLKSENRKKPTGSLAYFCGPLKLDPKIEPPSNSQFPDQMSTQVQNNANQLVKSNLFSLWPNFSRSQILDLYARPNIDPSDRYVLCLANTTQYRLKANASGL